MIDLLLGYVGRRWRDLRMLQTTVRAGAQARRDRRRWRCVLVARRVGKTSGLRSGAAGCDWARLESDHRGALCPALLEFGLVLDAVGDEDLLQDFILVLDRLERLLVLLYRDVGVGDLGGVRLS